MVVTLALPDPSAMAREHGRAKVLARRLGATGSLGHERDLVARHPNGLTMAVGPIENSFDAFVDANDLILMHAFLDDRPKNRRVLPEMFRRRLVRGVAPSVQITKNAPTRFLVGRIATRTPTTHQYLDSLWCARRRERVPKKR